jgi:hypothetical protein
MNASPVKRGLSPPHIIYNRGLPLLDPLLVDAVSAGSSMRRRDSEKLNSYVVMSEGVVVEEIERRIRK